MNKYEINDRVKQVMEACEMNQNQFSKLLETSSTRISNIMSHRNRPDSQILAQLCIKLTNLNARWLLTGQGTLWMEYTDMLTEQINSLSEKTEPYIVESNNYSYNELIKYIIAFEKRLKNLEKKVL